MQNPSRRNRNIGTPKQGFGQNNKLTIPSSWETLKSFYEKLTSYTKESRIINDHEFVFIVEETIENYIHCCSINDLENIIKHIPKNDYGSLKFIILRQPKRKEQILSSVWGRLIYSFEFEEEHFPAIILESTNINGKIFFPKKQSLENQKEFLRLKDDGHVFLEDKRNHTSQFNENAVRNTQLYRTLPHEFGHYVHYLRQVEETSFEGEDYEEWEKRFNLHWSLPSTEKENFAHQYADKFKIKLLKEGIIPFERL